MNLWQRIVESIRLRLDEAREARAVAREQREEVREVERQAYLKERLVVAVKEGKERARRPTGLKGFAEGVQTFSKNLDKIVPPQKKVNLKQPTIVDQIVGSNQKYKGKTMMDVKF